MPKPTLRVFVSSPGDVAEERVITGRVIQRVADRFASIVTNEPIFWEHEPLLATGSFQTQIERPSEADIFICILWSRLGTRLPQSIRRPDGSTYQSGTEFEFEDAFQSYRARKAPDLIVYRKTAEPFVSLKDRNVARLALAQSELLDEFIARWFHGADGTLIAAFHPFRDTAEFEEHLELHLIKLVGARVKRLGVAADEAPKSAPVTWTAGSPYRGLEAFEFEHEPIFFGRTRAVSGVLLALREQAEAGRPFVLVLGASGSGKSSLVKAGVLPMLTRPGVVPGVVTWRRAVLRPGDAGGDLWLALATALLRPEALPQITPAGLVPAKLAALLKDNPQRVLDRIKTVLHDLGRSADGAAKEAEGARLVLVVDQLEEVFTLDNVTAEARTAFFRLMEEMVRVGVWVLTTLRGDFYHRSAEAPELARLKSGKGQFDLQPPTASEVAAIIRQPAVAAGLRFGHNPQTGERLEELPCDAAVGHSGSLPLLEFTLDELYKRRSDQNGLTLKAYADLGGLDSLYHTSPGG